MSQLAFVSSDHKERKTYFVDVVLLLPLPKLYTYRVPYDMANHIKKGTRVIVQFGKKKILTSIAWHIHEIPPKQYEAKPILDILDEQPIINEQQFQLYQWMSEYYLCTPGEVFNAGMPAGLKLSSESRIQLHPAFDGDLSDLSEKEIELMELLEKNDSINYSDISLLITGSPHALIKKLVSKEAIILFEQVKDKYTPKKIKRVRIHSSYLVDNQLETLINELEKKTKQQEILLAYLRSVPIIQNPDKNELGIPKKELLTEKLSTSSYRSLLNRGVLEEWEEIVSRFDLKQLPSQQAISELNDAQTVAKVAVKQYFEKDQITLLHGVTGSGKTEIYIHLIQEAINTGKQVLYLLPEIALTTQIVARLKKIFGAELGIYHSRFSDNERVDTWKDLISGRTKVIIGVRSAIFLPFSNLGLTIIDEEHDASFKQYDPAPRYNARDSAIMLAQFHNSNVLLGSATPSVESYHKAITGKWGLVKLQDRFGDAKLPEIVLAESKFQNGVTIELKEEISKSLDKKNQSIIFQNRRGYSPYLICKDCAHIPYCPNCNVSLTYHMYLNELRCHYCGHSESVPPTCDACGSAQVSTSGYGTEKIEEEMSILFPEAAIRRMDLDTTRKKNSYEQLIGEFEQRHIDMLIGTQMVTKGLDFDHVDTVGIFDADRMIHFPDFRSHERAYQLMTQVAGRAGRKKQTGKVIIQTQDKNQLIFRYIIDHDYDTFFQKEIYERKKYLYPPYCRMIKLVIKNAEQAVSKRLCFELTQALGIKIGKQRVLGPIEPVINKIRNMYHHEVTIKLENNIKNVGVIKKQIIELTNAFLTKKEFKSCRYVVDVDPM